MAPILVPTLEELAGELDRAIAAERMASTVLTAGNATKADDDQHVAAAGYAASLCGQIAELPAQTFEHVRLKARALEWFAFPDPITSGSVDQVLAYQLVRALLYGVPS